MNLFLQFAASKKYYFVQCIPSALCMAENVSPMNSFFFLFSNIFHIDMISFNCARKHGFILWEIKNKVQNKKAYKKREGRTRINYLDIWETFSNLTESKGSSVLPLLIAAKFCLVYRGPGSQKTFFTRLSRWRSFK